MHRARYRTWRNFTEDYNFWLWGFKNALSGPFDSDDIRVQCKYNEMKCRTLPPIQLCQDNVSCSCDKNPRANVKNLKFQPCDKEILVTCQFMDGKFVFHSFLHDGYWVKKSLWLKFCNKLWLIIWYCATMCLCYYSGE